MITEATRGRCNNDHTQDSFGEPDDRHNDRICRAEHVPLRAGLSEEQQYTIDQIRSAAINRNGSADHSERLISLLETWLLDDEQKAVLAGAPLNIFYLYAAACLKEIDNIIEDRQALGIPELSQAQVVSKIIRTSVQPTEEWRHTQLPEVVSQGSSLCVDLLAGALALAERLDLHHPATLERIYQYVIRFVQPPKKNWSRRFRVESGGPHPHQAGAVLLRIHCRDAELHRGLKHYETDVERFLCGPNKMIRPCFLFHKVQFEIRSYGYAPMDIKFAVDGSAALQLFMGHTLYADKRVFLRELMQNAVDACHLRGLMESDYTPAIAVHLNAAENTLILKDNGIGMDRRWLEKYFLRVGISFYRSRELNDFSKDSGLQMHFISNFGIGFLSTFLVASRIMVRARKPGATGLSITIIDIGDYFDVRQTEDHLPVGTEVILQLKPSLVKPWRSMEFLGYLKNTARFVSIPIRFTDSQGNTTVIGCEPMNSFSSGISGQNFSAALQVPPSQGYLLIRTRGDHDRVLGLDSACGGISIFQNGIFITQTDDLLPHGAKGYVVGRLNLTGKHECELSMDRNRIFWSQQQLRFLRRAVLYGIADTTGQILKVVDHQNASQEIVRKRDQTAASVFELTTVDDVLFEALHPHIRRMLRGRFRAFLRTSISKADLQGRELSAIAASHGFQYQWQKLALVAMLQA